MSTSSQLIMISPLERLVVVDSRSATIEQDNLPRTGDRGNGREAESTAKVRLEYEKKLLAEREAMKKLWTSMESAFDAFVHDAESQIRDQLVDLSVRLAEIILRRELPDRNMIRELIMETLEPISDMQGATVRLSPDDRNLFMDGRQQDESDLLARIQIVSDEGLGHGDVLIESRNGYFDGRIGERLTLVTELLNERQRNVNEDDS